MSSETSDVPDPKPADGNDPQDPLRPEIEEENNEEDAPPLANPSLDMDATEDQQDATEHPIDDVGGDEESELSDVDEGAFDDFDTAALDIEERPVAIDETNVNLIGTHKRKRAEGEDTGEKKRKKKRKGDKKSRRHLDDDVDASGAGDVDGKRRRGKDAAEPSSRSRPRAKTPEDWDNLPEAERNRKELERKMDEALKNPLARRRKVTGIDLEAANDELLDRMARRMTVAAETDANDHKASKAALSKLSLLPEVMEILNRNTLQNSIVEPDSRMLEAVRFFLEPLEPDGALPAFNVQREMIGALARLPLDKDALASSGIGRVVLFYTKSKRPETAIKRAAERLIGEWTRPILKRSNDYRKRDIAKAASDNAPARPALSQAQIAAQAARERKLAKPVVGNRAMVDRQLPSYTIAPTSSIVGSQATNRSTNDSFAKLKARQQVRR